MPDGAAGPAPGESRWPTTGGEQDKDRYSKEVRADGDLSATGDSTPDSDTYRSDFLKDHDRVFYSGEFARLEGITQIATTVSTTVHNRLTHSYRVEQVARTIARRFSADFHTDEEAVAAAALGHDIGHPPFGHTGEIALQGVLLCSEHAKPTKLTNYLERKPKGEDPIEGGGTTPKELACEYDPPCRLIDGFEGNAQSFRILTRLAAKERENFEVEDAAGAFGLDLTRRSLRAGLKYPWTKGAEGRSVRKWGVYDSDVDAFHWAVNPQGSPAGEALPPALEKHLEADIMDTADDIAYAVHDLEDFHKAGVIPLHDITLNGEIAQRVLRYVRQDPEKRSGALGELVDAYDRWERQRQATLEQAVEATRGAPTGEDDSAKMVAETLARARQDVADVFASEPLLREVNGYLQDLHADRYDDSYTSRARLRRIRSDLIELFVTDLIVDADAPQLELSFERKSVEALMGFLKQMTWFFVIEDPGLIAIREGQVRMVTACFEFLYGKACDIYIRKQGKNSYWNPVEEARGVPTRLDEYVKLGRARSGRYLPIEVVARATVDYICSMTDDEMYVFSAQLSGSQAHSVPTTFGGP